MSRRQNLFHIINACLGKWRIITASKPIEAKKFIEKTEAVSDKSD